MSKEDMRAEAVYLTTMRFAREMLDDGIITKNEYREIEAVFKEKYNPTIGVLFSTLS